MQLVIRVDLDKAEQSLADVFKSIGDCRWTDEVQQGSTDGAVVLNKDDRPSIIGEWSLEETEATRHPLDSLFRAAATERYARPRQIEVDRFATVSLTDDGAYVEGWLYVPRAEVVSTAEESSVLKKPPLSVVPVARPASSRIQAATHQMRNVR